ncbi:MAG: DUF1924 domain-containing protein, partial [Candidatus Scalindua sp.]|nr:DUF1924 domain-containing protein [Candidatus Scalindua sp.]
MKKNITAALSTCIVLLSLHVEANDAITQLENQYQNEGATDFDASKGKALWDKNFTDAKTGKTRNCSTCHGSDLNQAGKHVRTNKLIKAMAPSANPERYTKVKKIKKWFLRNC